MKDSEDKYTRDPLTDKGKKIIGAMQKHYGEKKGKQVFYASKNAGRIKGVDGIVMSGVVKLAEKAANAFIKGVSTTLTGDARVRNLMKRAARASKDDNIDLMRMYQKNLEAAIESGNKEEQIRWSREVYKMIMPTNNILFSIQDKACRVKDEAFIIGKHNDVPDAQFDQEELKKGIEVEMEHTDNPEVAKAIAKDHLSEMDDYYTRLLEMEGR